METRLVNNVITVLAIPSQLIHALLEPWLLENDPDRVGETNEIVRGVRRQKKELAFADSEVSEGRRRWFKVD